MRISVGVRDFRHDLADYIDQDEAVAVTRHGRQVGVFIPTRNDRAEAVAAFREATDKLHALLDFDESEVDEIAAEFDQLRKADRKAAANQ